MWWPLPKPPLKVATSWEENKGSDNQAFLYAGEPRLPLVDLISRGAVAERTEL